MKAKMSYKSKKIAIITAIILVLIAGIATGTYYFIKGNDETRAAYEENQELTQGNRGESETTQGQEEKPNTDEPSNQDENIQNDENEGTNGTDNTTDNESNSSTTTGNGTNSGTTTGNNQNTSNGNNDDAELPNEEYTQTDIIEREEERETQNLTVAWNNIDLSRAQMSTNINTNKPVLEINKVAKLNSLNENDNAVQEGSKITYEITVTNKSAEIDASNVNISDIIPEGTKLVENSISNDGIVENEKISWTVDVSRNSSVTVSFTVEVVSTENDIKNVAVVDGKDTPETVNPVIETSKEAVLPEGKTAVAQGDEITYKITVTNKGNEKAIATVKDTIPTGTTLIPDSITNEGVETNSDIIWNVNVEKGQSIVLSFTVKVNEDNTLVGPISNTAYVNEVPTEEVETNVEAHIIFEENGGKEVPDVNGFAGDKIDDRNPETTRAGYDFDGWYTEPEFTNKIEQLPEKMVAGTTTYYAKWIARDDTKYTVEFYYQKDGKYPSAATVKDLTRTGTTDTEASVTEADKTPDAEKGNYVFDEEAGNMLSGIINGNGSLVLKVYFKEQFTVKYNPGTQGTFAEQTTGSLDYGTSTPTFNGEITGNAGYTFAGWTPEVAETVTADVTYTAQWRANTNTKYTVEYYYEEDGTYPETAIASVERTGTTDTEASVTEADKTPDAEKGNYVFDEEAGNILSGTINGNGSLVLKVYFKEQFTVKYNPGTQGTFAEQTTGSLDYGTSTPTFEGEITGNAGYTFAGWTPEVAETVTADVTYTAQWRANTNTKYTVEYYYEEDGTYPETATASVERTGTTDTEASVTEADKTPDAEKGNYVFDEEAGNILSGTINGNGSLVLKVYFKEQFTVKYNPGTQGTFTEQTTGSLDYGTSTPAFEEEITGNAGYTFAGWTPEVAEKVTADVTYTAQWRANTNTKYTVEYYYEEDGTYPETAIASVERTGTTDTEASVTEADKTPDAEKGNYVFDEEAGNILSGTINGNGSLVLKVYFKEQFTVKYNPGTQGTFAEQTTGNLDYGTSTPTFEGEITGNAGYTFAGWTPEVAEKVTADATYTAKWTANTDTPYTVEYYYETNGNYTTTPDSTDSRTGTTGAKVSVTDEDKQSTKTGYVFDESYKGNIIDGTIRGDGSLVLKVYFKQQFTIKYNKGTQGNFENEEYTTTYGAETPEFKGKTTGKEGFYFAGWDKEIKETVTEDVEYTALWEGLDISKTRTEIVDKDELDNTFVDQAGDIIKYTIKITNVGDVNASNIKLTDNHKVKVTGVKMGAVNVDISDRNNVFEAGKDLLEELTTTIEPNTSIEVTVEYTVTENELEEALKSDSKAIINTATATLNGHEYEAKDKTNGKTGTEVKERATYRIEYYYNGDKVNTIEGTTIVGATISFERPSELEGYTYIKYVGVDGKENGSTTASDGLNVIKVYYGKPEISITKGSTETVNAGENIKYTITVKNTGYIGTTVTVTDELLGTTYVKNSSKIDNKTSEPTITTNKDKNEVLSWEITLDAQDSKEITFEATTANDSFGDKISNTAKIKDSDKSASTSSKVNEINVKYNEYKEGQKGTDLNIIFVLDNSSSMNYPIEGQSYKYNNYPIAPTDKDKTRIENAKEAIKGFIDNQSSNVNTDMSVITFNTTNTGTETGYRTLMDIKEEDTFVEGGIFNRKRYTMIDGEKYRVTNDKVTGSDGNKYYGVYLPIEYGARLVGTNAESNSALKTAVDNISISSEKSGFGTYVGNAFSLINNNKEQYLSDEKKNIVIVLADGEFNGYYWNALTTLKGNVDDIYSIGFGSGKDYDAEALKEVSTNNTCYTATNSSDLLDKFNEILEEATGTEQTGITEKGKITFKQATGAIKVSEDCPIEATYTDAEGATQTLFKCTSEKDLSNYGLSISGGRITWDAKQFVNNKNTKVPGEISIKYYTAREQ